jgi:hypothetical protein
LGGGVEKAAVDGGDGRGADLGCAGDFAVDYEAVGSVRLAGVVAVLCVVHWASGASGGDAARRAAVKLAVGRIAAREGVDVRLAEAVAETESAYDSEAVSGKGAVGVMQLMPGTARALGVRNVRDIEENITGGVRYLKYLRALYGGDLHLVLAAYNAGPGAVAKYRGVPPYMETREYITAVMGRYYGVRLERRKGARKVASVLLAGGPTVCGGSEMAYDAGGRLYVRARAVGAECGARER